MADIRINHRTHLIAWTMTASDAEELAYVLELRDDAGTVVDGAQLREAAMVARAGERHALAQRVNGE